MYLRLEEILGSEEPSTLLNHLPPGGWADVATKQDLEHLRVATQKDLLALNLKLDAKLESKLNAQTHTMVMTMVAMQGLAFAAARLA